MSSAWAPRQRRLRRSPPSARSRPSMAQGPSARRLEPPALLRRLALHLARGAHDGRARVADRLLAPPHLPRRAALGIERLERLQVLEGVDAAPEAGIGASLELLPLDEAAERLLHQLLAGLEIVED